MSSTDTYIPVCRTEGGCEDLKAYIIQMGRPKEDVITLSQRCEEYHAGKPEAALGQLCVIKDAVWTKTSHNEETL